MTQLPKLLNQADSSPVGLDEIIAGIREAGTVADACLVFRDYFAALGGELLSVKFCDTQNESDVIRPYTNYPPAVMKVGTVLGMTGGCPFAKESIRLLRPISIHEIDRSTYNTEMEQRFLKEVDALGHSDLSVLPVMIGRGMALATVGWFDRKFSGELRDEITNALPHVIAAFMSRFPEVGNLFERKLLNARERSVIQMLCEGRTELEISRQMGFSAHTLHLLLQNASGKLNASNTPQLVYRSMILGEIQNISS